MDPLTYESPPALLESDQFHSSNEVKPTNPQWILSFNVVTGLGRKNLCRFADYEPGIAHKFLCNVQKLRSSPFLPYARYVRWIFHQMLERLDFDDFEIDQLLVQQPTGQFEILLSFLDIAVFPERVLSSADIVQHILDFLLLWNVFRV